MRLVEVGRVVLCITMVRSEPLPLETRVAYSLVPRGVCEGNEIAELIQSLEVLLGNGRHGARLGLGLRGRGLGGSRRSGGSGLGLAVERADLKLLLVLLQDALIVVLPELL